MIIRGKVMIGKLVQSVIYAGSPTKLRIIDGKVIDENGKEIKERRLKDLFKKGRI